MMRIGKNLLGTGLKLTCPIKYAHPMINSAKWFSGDPSSISEKDKATLKFNFDEEDVDHDELININDFNHFIQRTMGRSLDSRELYILFAELDQNYDAHLSFSDVLKHFEKQFQTPTEARLKEVFCLYDKDEDGKIKLHELREVLFHLGYLASRSANLQKYFEKRDPKKIRKINYEEFKKLLKEDMPILMGQ
nr:squidulin-like [Halyomorpha halys]